MTRLNINLKCLAGSTLALISFSMIWGTRTSSSLQGPYNQHFTLLDFVGLTSYIEGTMLFAVIFFICTVLAFISPLAGIGQLVGSSGYVFIIGAIPSNQTGEHWWGGAGVGAYVGLVAAVIVILGLIFPRGIGLRREQLSPWDGILSVSPFPPSLLRVNLLAVAGAVLGITSMGLVWYTSWGSSGGTTLLAHLMYFGITMNGPAVSTQGFSYAAYVVLFGSILAVAVTPIGGIIMIVGDAVFVSTALQINSVYPGMVETGLGLYIGVFSGVIVLASLVRPWGLGYLSEHRDMRARFITWGRLHRPKA